MPRPPETKEELNDALDKIERKGFIASLRKSNTGIGFTPEEELGIREKSEKGFKEGGNNIGYCPQKWQS